jgi:hypothetical protein
MASLVDACGALQALHFHRCSCMFTIYISNQISDAWDRPSNIVTEGISNCNFYAVVY